MCARAVLGDPLPPVQLGKPKDSAVQTVRDVVRNHCRFWKCLEMTDCILPDSLSAVNTVTSEDPVTDVEKDMAELAIGPARSVQRSKLVNQ